MSTKISTHLKKLITTLLYPFKGRTTYSKSSIVQNLGAVFRLIQCHIRFNYAKILMQGLGILMLCALFSFITYIHTQQDNQRTTLLLEALMKSPSEQIKNSIQLFQISSTSEHSSNDKANSNVLNIWIALTKDWVFHIKPVTVFEDPHNPWPIGTREAILKAGYLTQSSPSLPAFLSLDLHSSTSLSSSALNNSKTIDLKNQRETVDFKNLDSQVVVSWIQDSTLPGGGKWVVRHNLSLEKYQALSAALLGVSDGPRKMWYWRQGQNNPNHPYVTGFYQNILGNPDELKPPQNNGLNLLLISMMTVLLFEIFMANYAIKWDKRRQQGELMVYLQYPRPMWVDYWSELLFGMLQLFLSIVVLTCSIVFISHEYWMGLKMGVILGLIASLGMMALNLFFLSLTLSTSLLLIRRGMMIIITLGGWMLFTTSISTLLETAQKQSLTYLSHIFSYSSVLQSLEAHMIGIISLEILMSCFLCLILGLILRYRCWNFS